MTRKTIDSEIEVSINEDEAVIILSNNISNQYGCMMSFKRGLRGNKWVRENEFKLGKESMENCANGQVVYHIPFIQNNRNYN